MEATHDTYQTKTGLLCLIVGTVVIRINRRLESIIFDRLFLNKNAPLDPRNTAIVIPFSAF
jgi:hypothetical protein